MGVNIAGVIVVAGDAAQVLAQWQARLEVAPDGLQPDLPRWNRVESKLWLAWPGLSLGPAALVEMSASVIDISARHGRHTCTRAQMLVLRYSRMPFLCQAGRHTSPLPPQASLQFSKRLRCPDAHRTSTAGVGVLCLDLCFSPGCCVQICVLGVYYALDLLSSKAFTYRQGTRA